MYPIDATTERFETVEILGIPALFTTLRVSRATIPKGMYAYDNGMGDGLLPVPLFSSLFIDTPW